MNTLGVSIMDSFLESAFAREMKILWSKYDTFTTETMLSAFESLGWEQIRHPAEATKDLPLVKTPTALVTTIIGYLLIIGVTFLKRSFFSDKIPMNGAKKPDPKWLRNFMLFHNIFLVVLSTFMCFGTVYQVVKYNYTFWGNLYNPEQTGLAYMLYIFYLSKLYEFNDTFIMLLKGNIHQVSFLHVYHHISISIVWWFLVYSCPGGDTYYTCALNSFVHILMYTYYLLALVVGKDPKKREKYLWWGKYMTQFQMAQFVSMMIQAIYCYIYSEYPKFLAVFLFIYMITLFALFGNFYLRKHVFKSKKKLA